MPLQPYSTVITMGKNYDNIFGILNPVSRQGMAVNADKTKFMVSTNTESTRLEISVKDDNFNLWVYRHEQNN